VTSQHKYKCCNRIYQRRSHTALPANCPFCGAENASAEEVDKEDRVIVGTGFSGDKGFEERPWGNFKILLDEPNVKVKKITVKPNQKLSLQLHKLRDEWWKIILGRGEIQINENKFEADQRDTVVIKKYEVHTVKNIGNEDLIFVEVQTGVCKEDDIVRLEDDYGRID
jgi:mannose-6-phosphate isomerase